MKRKKSTKNAFVFAFISLFLGLSCFVLGGVFVNYCSDIGFAVEGEGEPEVSANYDADIGLEVKWTSDEGGYFYFEDGLYPQSYAGYISADNIETWISNPAVTGVGEMSFAGVNHSVFQYNGELFLAVRGVSAKTIKLKTNLEADLESGISPTTQKVTFNDDDAYLFRFEPIRWRVSGFGVKEDECPLISGSSTFQERFSTLTRYAVSNLVLHYGSSGMLGKNMTYAGGNISKELYSNSDSNWKFLSETFNAAGSVTYNLDKISNSSTNVKLEQTTTSMTGFVQSSLEEIDTLYKTENSKFNEHRKARASDLVCMFMGVDYTDFCDYSTRTLYNNQNCRKVNAFGTDKNLWLDTDYGMRLTYGTIFKQNMIGLWSGTALNGMFKAESSGTYVDKTVKKIVFDYYRDAYGKKTSQEEYYVDGINVLTEEVISGAGDVTNDRNGKVKRYNKGQETLYVLSKYGIVLNYNSDYTFKNLGTLETIEFKNINTSRVTRMIEMFMDCGSADTVANFNLDLSSFNTSNVTNMKNMFNGCAEYATNASLNFSGWDTSKVTDMTSMFSGYQGRSTNFHLDLSGLDTSNVTSMLGMFSSCGSKATDFYLDVSGLDTSKVTNMSSMFSGCGSASTNFSINLSGLDTSKVTGMGSMFSSCASVATAIHLDLSSFNTSSVTSMYGMFDCFAREIENFNLDLSNFDTTNVTNMSHMFYWSAMYSKSVNLNLSSFDTSSVTNMSYMFEGFGRDSTIFNLDLSNFDTAKVTNMSYMFDGAGENSESFFLDISNFNASNVTNVTKLFYECGYDAIDFELDMSYFVFPANASGLLQNCGYSATEFKLNLYNCDTSNVTDMSSMFSGCGYSATDFSLNLLSFDTSKVTSMSSMFSRCGYNTSNFYLDLQHFRTSNVTKMDNMFFACGHEATDFGIYLPHFDTSNVTTMSYMFWNCGGNSVEFDLDLSHFNTSKVTSMGSMFFGCGKNSTTFYLDVSNFDTSNVTSMGSMFDACGATMLDLSSFDTSKVTGMTYMFRNCTKLQTIYVSEKWDVSAVTSSSSMFSGCSNLVGGNGTVYSSSYTDKTYARIDTVGNPGYLTDAEERYSARLKTGLEMNALMKGSTSNGTNSTVTSIIFDYYRDQEGNPSGKEIYYDENGRDLILGTTGVDATSNGTGNAKVYFGGKATVYILSVGKMYMNEDAFQMFMYFVGNSASEFKVKFINFDTSRVTNMSSMFYQAFQEATVLNLDLSGFDTSNVTNMNQMFNNCALNVQNFSLDVSNFDTSKVTGMSWMFNGCAKKSSTLNLDLSSFDTSNITSMSGMFTNCGHDATNWSLDISNFNTSNVVNMSNMFSDCGYNATNFSLDLSSFDTTKVDDMTGMFSNCGYNSNSWTLDLSNFYTIGVSYAERMFYNCKTLTTIYVSDKWVTTRFDYSDEMFLGCTSLVGGNGTVYNENNVTKTYARVDASGTPGYFTYKASSNGAETDNPAENSVANWESLVIVFGLIAVLFSFFTFCVFYVKRIKHGDKNFKI